MANIFRLAGSQTQKGITTYAISANRQRPRTGAANAAIFNTWRRFRAQALYFIPPLAAAYLAMNWAIEKYVLDGAALGYCLITSGSNTVNYSSRNEYLNSKPGRMHDAEESAEARQGGSVRG